MTLASRDSINIDLQFDGPLLISSYRYHPSIYKHSVPILITKVPTNLTICYYHSASLFRLLNPAIILRIVHRWIDNEQPPVSISLRQYAEIMDRGRATMTTPTMTLELRIRIKQLFDTGFSLVNRGHGHSRQESRRLDNVIDWRFGRWSAPACAGMRACGSARIAAQFVIARICRRLDGAVHRRARKMIIRGFAVGSCRGATPDRSVFD